MDHLISNSLFAWFVLLIAFLFVFKSNWFKGVFGEWQVNLLIKLFLDKNHYHLIKNVTLPTDNGTTQVDHIIVSKHGIFVVETKNIKGWIFSVIIFIGDSEFKTKMPENVTFARGGIEFIKSKTAVLIDDHTLASLVKKIEHTRLTPSLKTDRQHIKHVKEIISRKTNETADETLNATVNETADETLNATVNEKHCNKCGAVMIKRKATKGKKSGNSFWGCGAFPKCRNIENIA
jgi:restriction system protein